MLLHPGRNRPLNSSLNYTEVRFGTESKKDVVDDDDSGICSPPLWRTSPPTSPKQRNKNHYRSLSPASRTQAVARGQKELMDMVRNMPESSYELSLKDLVEKHWLEAREENSTEERKFNARNGFAKEGSVRKSQGKRNGNIDGGGFYLKMMFPISLGSKKKKKKSETTTAANGSSKVSPRPSVSDGSVKGAADKDWWKKKNLSESVKSDSGVSSINSGSTKSSGSSSRSSSSRSNSRHESSGVGCWPFTPLISRPRSLTQK